MKSRYWGRLAILLASVLAVIAVAQVSVAVADPQLPARTGAVVDAADIIRPNQEQALAARAENLKSASNVELVVVTLPSLQGYSIERWGRELGNGWRVGGGTARGVLLIVAPNDREVRIEVGDGLPLSDSAAASIIDNVIIPQFRSGEMSGGILAGADAIANAIVRPSGRTAEPSPIGTFFKGLDWSAIQMWGFAGVMLVSSFFSSGSGRSRSRGSFSSGRSYGSGRSSRSFSGRGASGRW